MDIGFKTIWQYKKVVLLLSGLCMCCFANARPKILIEVPPVKRTPPPKEQFHTVELDGEQVQQGGFLIGQTADSDQDGVPDATDQCPQTTNNETVNSQGCSQTQITTVVTPAIVSNLTTDFANCDLDSDKDGIKNCQDQCNYTLPNLKIDINGCIDFEQESQISTLDLKFDTNDWAMKPEFESALTQLKGFLQQHRTLDITIYGHSLWVSAPPKDESFSYWLTYWRTNNILNQLRSTDKINTENLRAAEYSEVMPIEMHHEAYSALQNQKIHIHIQTKSMKNR